MTDFSQETERYFDLAERLESLHARAQDASPVAKELIGQAIETATQQIGGLMLEPLVQQEVGAYGQQTMAEMEELDGLGDLVQLGILPQETLDEKTAELAADPRRQLAVSYIQSTGLVADHVKVKPVKDATPKPQTDLGPNASETLTEKIKLKLTIRENIIMLGDRGKIVKLSTRESDRYKNRAGSRVALLEALVGHPEEEISTKELWQLAFPGQKIENYVLFNFRNWMKELSYRRIPLILHNGKMGTASRYSVNPRFDLRIVDEKVVTRRSTPKTESSIDAEKRELAPKKSGDPLEDIPKVVAAYGENSPGIHFPLTLIESSVVAAFIDFHKDYLESQHGIDPMSSEISDRLQNLAQPRHQEVMHTLISRELESEGIVPTTDVVLQKVRQMVIEKLKNFFTDEDALVETINTMSEKDYRYELFEYLFSIDREDLWLLLDTITQAQVGSVVAVNPRTRTVTSLTRVTEIDGVGTSYGEPIVVDHESDDESDETNTSQQRRSTDVITSSTNLPAVSLDPAEAEAIVARLGSATPEESDLGHAPELNSERSEFVTTLKARCWEWLMVVDSHSLEGKSPTAIANAFKEAGTPYSGEWVRRGSLESAASNGYIRQKAGAKGIRKEINAEDIVRFSILSSSEFKTAYTTRNSRSKPDRRLVDKVIEEVLREYYEKKK